MMKKNGSAYCATGNGLIVTVLKGLTLPTIISKTVGVVVGKREGGGGGGEGGCH